MKILWRTLVGIWNHGAIGYAKASAYSALLAFFPVLTTLTTILVQANAETVSHKIVEVLLGVAPAGTEGLVRQFFTTRGQRPLGLPIFATLLALWAASGVMISLMEGFQAILQIPNRRGIVRQRLVATWMVVVGVLPVVAASAMMLFGERTERFLFYLLGFWDLDQRLSGGIAFAGRLLRYATVLTTMLVVTSLFYYFGPDSPKQKRRILPGALVSTTVWKLATLAFAWYMRNIGSYNVLYGSIGAAIALLVWLYTLSLTSLIGFEFNVVLSKR